MSNLMERITANPRQCGGRPCIRGMRIRVTDVLDLLASGQTREQVLDICRISKRRTSRRVCDSAPGASITRLS